MYCRTMEQLKEGVAEMEVDDGQERRQDQQEELHAEASETVGERGRGGWWWCYGGYEEEVWGAA